MAKKIDYAALFTLRKDGRYCGTYVDERGKRHYVYGRDPEALYRRIEAEKEKPPLSFMDVAEAWEREHFERIGWKTAEAYAAPLARIKCQFGGEKPEEIGGAEVSAFLAQLAKQGYARRSVQMHRDILNMIFNHAIVAGSVKFNPVAAVALPRNLPHTPREMPTDEEIAAIRQTTDHYFALFAQLCLYAGLRRGEALALRYEDIDRERKVIHVRRAVEFVGGEPRIKEPKTSAGLRDVPLLDALAAVLPDGKSGYLFTRKDGRPLSVSSYNKRWKSYCEYAGVNITAHQLRHGFATILFEAGVADKDAQEILGHSDIAVTRNIYTHIRQARREKTAELINAYLSG